MPDADQDARAKSIIILGAGKSGTTALFYAVRQAIVEETGKPIEGLFEPVEQRVIDDYLKSGKDAIPLTKVLLGPILRKGTDVISLFQKRVVIYRDPRDNIISRIVFMLPRIVPVSEQDKVGRLVELFRRKEAAPDSISVVAMMREIAALSGRDRLLESVRENSILPAKMKRERASELFLMPYDDMVQGKFADLNGYLGLNVKAGVEVDQRHSYVIRTKGSGEWRNWFLDEDIQYFAKDVADDFAILGFDPGERPLSERTINPATCSEYVTAMYTRHREQRRERRRKANAA